MATSDDAPSARLRNFSFTRRAGYGFVWDYMNGLAASFSVALPAHGRACATENASVPIGTDVSAPSRESERQIKG